MRLVIVTVLAAFTLLNSGCVTKGTHEATLQELGKTRDSLSFAEATIAKQQRQIENNKNEIARTKSELSELEKKKAALQQEFEASQNRLDASESKLKASQAEFNKSQSQLEESQSKFNASQSQLEASQSKFNESQSKLDESRSQLETMRQIEAETKKRNEIYARFVKELQKMIDGGQLTVSIEQGRIVINLPDNVLFASGRATVNAEGQEALTQIAGVLKEFSDRRFQIEGHTDNVPMKSSRYPSNWELSTARALSVVHLMTQKGVQAQNVSAAGFGEFHPRADNETKEGRALNRRIEIVMLPNLEILSNELPKVAQ